MIEVLAPAGSPEAFEAACRTGADAVYFGVSGFNARRNAKNFTEADMASAVSYARTRGIKTYLTLNTLTADSELSAALNVALSAAKAGVDALIVQDVGLIRTLKKHLPNMPLHASTQMSVHSAAALPVLKQMGISRVVVAREVDKNALVEICQKAKELNMEIEAFVHGALCMCLSGQCYLSSVLGGRSGNRGLCAQPCRLQFSVPNGTGHDLSLKDMSLIDHIGEMAKMGVVSFKIEGRMKRPEYVAAAVTAVRDAADGKTLSEEATELLMGLFSRSGHTDGYYTDNLGVNMFGIRTEADSAMSAKMVNSAHELYRRERQRVPLSATVTAKKGEPLEITVCDRDKHSTTVKGDIPQEAVTRETTKEDIIAKLNKCGGTCYYFENISCVLDKGLSISASSISKLRGDCLNEITAQRERYDGSRAKDNTVDSFAPILATAEKKDIKKVAFFRSASQIPEVLNGLSAVILPVEADWENICIPKSIPLLADIPRGVLHTEQQVIKHLQKAKANGAKAAVCNNLAAFTLAKEVGLPVVAGFSMNIYNSESLKAVNEMGARAAVCSFEMLLSDAVRCYSPIPKGIITYGKLPLMLFCNCPNKNGNGCKDCGGHCEITDRLGVKFPIMCRGEFSEMFNSRPLWMFDRKNEINGIDFEVLMFTDEPRERCAEVLKSAENQAAPDREFTRGLYYREVL